MNKKSHQLINADSGSDEYYTPAAIVEAARAVMGWIDLDPASSLTANKRVMAVRFFSAEDDGLALPWAGRVWLNHPFGRKTNGPWIAKLVAEVQAGRVWESCNICFASTSEAWFRPLMSESAAQCFIHGRTGYHLPSGGLLPGATKGSVVSYFGENVAGFAREFSKFGTVKVNWRG